MNIGNQQTVSLPSGAELEMTLAPFTEGDRLLTAAAECLKGLKISGQEDINFSSIKDAFLSCLTSKEMKDAILGCLKRCTYNKQRITSWDIFDDIDARGDYITVCWEVCKFNLAPFMKNLISRLSALSELTKTSQK